MKFSALYTNRPEFFEPIEFCPELNVVLAEIRVPENKNKDTHNLGKTTLGSVIDYCLLKRKNSQFFLFKHFDRFENLVFFLEIESLDGKYITIRRSVREATLISIKYHSLRNQDFTSISADQWDHFDITFEKAKEILDGVLDWRDISPSPFRKLVGYLLRSQDDYKEVFQLRKFQSRHIDWKPFLSAILGFDGQLVYSQYLKEHDLDEAKKEADVIRNELGGAIEDAGKIEGLLLLKRQDADKRQKILDAFDFRMPDQDRTKQVVDKIDVRISELNTERYRLNSMRKKVMAAIEEDQILFSPDEAERLFNEVGVFFGGQIKRDFDQLLQFNRALTEERAMYLKEERIEIDLELKSINAEIESLGTQRSKVLGFLSTTDIFSKYKQASDEIVILKAEISMLEKQQGDLHRLQEKRAVIRSLSEEAEKYRALVEDNVSQITSADSDSVFSTIRLYFSEIIEEVINRKALLRVFINESGHLDFKAEILDDSGNTTSADFGNTYRKLLCVAFDLALVRAHLPGRFPRTIFHDGVFEKLDPRKKERMLHVLRTYTDIGIQLVITLLDSEMPPSSDGEESPFAPSEIILVLHDEGDNGRLFKGPSW